jgi:RNA polymerase-binding transcription factor
MAKAAPAKKHAKPAPARAKVGAKVGAKTATPAKKAQTTAKKAAPAKKATVAKKSQASATAAKRTAAKKAPAVKKAPVKKAPVKKAPAAKKAPVKKAPVKKAPAAKKAPVKQAAATKQAAAPATRGAPTPAPMRAATRGPVKATPVKGDPAKKSSRKPTVVICPLSGFEVKPEKPGLSPKTIERLRASLLEERARHVQQADELAAEAEQLAAEREGGDTQFDEESGEGDTINIERERDLLLSASAQQIVDEIDRAIERMENQTYGLCLPAGRRISLERLEALPYAETCVDCKARAERRR